MLHAALAQGRDSADVAGLADSAMIRTNRRASRTKAPEDYQEAVALGQFADSIHAKLGGDVARRPAPAGGSAPQQR